MAKTKTRYIQLNAEKSSFIYKFISKKEQDFSDVELLRQILSKEKSRILYTLKTEKVTSIYHLSKILKRDFKAVWQDLQLLKRFGFIVFKKETKGKRKSLIPVLDIDRMELVISV